MEAGTVLVLADADRAAEARAFAAGQPTALVVEFDEQGPGEAWARLCAQVAGTDPSPPLSIIAFGPLARHLAHVARAQRATHKRVIEYVMVRPVLPPVTDSWPDAPVSVYCEPSDEASLPSRLRGWAVRPTDELSLWRPAD